ncbi:MAG: amidohydrolase [Odoribacter sp.]
MKVALVQSTLVWGDVEKNLEHFDRELSRIEGCGVIVLPEMFTSGSRMVKVSKEVAEAEKCRVAAQYTAVREKMTEWAVRQGALVVGSTVYEEAGRYYNRLLAVFPDGGCQCYDKRHCFRMGGENEHFTAGTRQLVFDYEGVRMAVFICYDLRFPVWCRNTERYDLAVYVANWPEARREVWKVLLRARAIENQAFVVGVNCVGEDVNGICYAGDSLVADARGNVVAKAQAFQEETLVVELDVAELHRFRDQFDVLEDRDDFIINLNYKR